MLHNESKIFFPNSLFGICLFIYDFPCADLYCRSSAHGISFEIQFDDPMTSTSSQGLSRSASSEGLGFKIPNSARGMRRNLSFQPVNGSTHTPLQEEEDDDITSHHGPVRPLDRTDSRYFFSDTWAAKEIASAYFH